MKRIFGLILLVISFTSAAEETTGWAKVTEVWSGYGSGMILFKLDIAHLNPGSCPSSGFYAVDPATADSSKFLSILLAAKASKANVQMKISSSACFYNYPTALRVGIK